MLAALYQIGKRVQHAFLAGFFGTQIKAALPDAVGVAVPAFIGHDGLLGDFARAVAIPVRNEASGFVVAVGRFAGEGGVAAVQSVRFPDRIGAEIPRVVFEDGH